MENSQRHHLLREPIRGQLKAITNYIEPDFGFVDLTLLTFGEPGEELSSEASIFHSVKLRAGAHLG